MLLNYRLLMIALFWCISASSIGCGVTRFAQWNETPNSNFREGSEEAAKLEVQGDFFFEKRAESTNLRIALMKWELASDLQLSVRLCLKLSRGHFLLAQSLAGEVERSTEQEVHYGIGLGFAEKGLAVSAPSFIEKVRLGVTFDKAVLNFPKESTPLLYWYAANLEKWASTKGTLTILRYKKRVSAAMAQVLKSNEKIESYGRLSDSESVNKH